MLHQDASVHVARLDPDTEVVHPIGPGRGRVRLPDRGRRLLRRRGALHRGCRRSDRCGRAAHPRLPDLASSSSSTCRCSSSRSGSGATGSEAEPQLRWLSQSGGTRPAGPGTGWSGRMLVWRGELRSLRELVGHEVVEPVLVRLEAPNDRVLLVDGVMAGMLGWRRVAAADMAAMRAPTEVVPPPVRRKAFHASGPAGRNGWIDRAGFRHHTLLAGKGQAYAQSVPIGRIADDGIDTKRRGIAMTISTFTAGSAPAPARSAPMSRASATSAPRRSHAAAGPGTSASSRPSACSPS